MNSLELNLLLLEGVTSPDSTSDNKNDDIQIPAAASAMVLLSQMQSMDMAVENAAISNVSAVSNAGAAAEANTATTTNNTSSGGTLGATSGGDSPKFPTWPYQPEKDGGLPPGFDPSNVPKDAAGILSQIQAWLNAIKDYKTNINLLGGFLEFLVNVQNYANASGDKSLQDTVTKAFGTLASMNYLTLFFTETLRNAWFFEDLPAGYSSHEEFATAQMNILKELFDKEAKENPDNAFFQQMKGWVDQKTASLPSFFKDNENADGDPKYTPEQAWIAIQGASVDFFTTDNTMSDLLHEMFMQLVDYIISHYANMGVILISLIFDAFGLGLNDKQTSLGAYGNLSNNLKKLADDNNSILNDFGYDFTGNSLQSFIQDITKQMFTVDELKNYFGSTVQSSIDAFGQDFLNKLKVKIDGKTYTLAQLIGPDAPKDIDWSDVASQVNVDLQNTDDDGKPDGTPNELYQTLTGELKAATQSISDQSQTVSTIQSQISDMINTITNFIDTMANKDISGWMQKIVDNMKTY